MLILKVKREDLIRHAGGNQCGVAVFRHHIVHRGIVNGIVVMKDRAKADIEVRIIFCRGEVRQRTYHYRQIVHVIYRDNK